MTSISGGLRVSALAALVALAVAACSSSAPSAEPTPEISPLANSQWQLSSMLGRPAVSPTPVTLNFAVVKAGGSTSCNQYQMQYATLDTGIRFGAVAATRALCGDLQDGLEQQYYTELGLITHYELSGDTLTLRTAPGDADLVYSRMAAASVDGPWNITHVNNGQQGVTSIPSGVSASISFLPDNTVQGNGGCNDFSGGYTVEGDNITIGPLMGTLKACGEPADTFERQLMAALGNSTKWSVSAGTLDLRDAGGAQQVQATSAVGR
jgi:heat shock protein HslJ